MKKYIILLALFLFGLSHANTQNKQQEPFDIFAPELIFRPQTPEEAFFFVEYLVNRLPWYKENGYNIILPVHPKLEFWYQNTQALSRNDKDELKQIFNAEIYDKRVFDLSLVKLNDAKSAVNAGLGKLSVLAKNWGFDLKEKYNIVLTLYGPGGNYNTSTSTATLLTTKKGEFCRKGVEEIVLHEIVHIGIEESIVKKYKLSHWEKERLVDLICYHCLNEILPNYWMQQKGDKRIDAFVDQHAITHDLPLTIARFVELHVR